MLTTIERLHHFPQQCLNFLPEPQGHRSFLPTFLFVKVFISAIHVHMYQFLSHLDCKGTKSFVNLFVFARKFILSRQFIPFSQPPAPPYHKEAPLLFEIPRLHHFFRTSLFRTTSVPFTLEGGPPLPVSPLLRRGEKQKVAEADNLLWCFGIAGRRDGFFIRRRDGFFVKKKLFSLF